MSDTLSDRNIPVSAPARTLWLTGLPSSGKTTTAIALVKALKAAGVPAENLDGDELRRQIGGGLGFSREDRMENVRRAVYVSGLLNKHGVTAVVSLISPYAEMRDYARSMLPGFTEIYIDCPLEECERRDVKGLYALARRGEIHSFTGISDVYEPPEVPELTLDTQRASVEENVAAVLGLVGCSVPNSSF
ncbi:adenylyl-sulfate kinase [Saccharibacillus sp. CPCC 101409]|uniref:adenylyl-sulfate kinase n=1 Tax=Saccharibacillus sp. CPCC 101409 TaxID=3058041 RepID=UPI002672104D|nr:adenylyl-sulfate kinase [Saccharibacillus sp. CPCC 101409]MDO3409554.1 adenylyl-sulfate kinase [Saccharibacillus sp. CPCC 101409]